MKNKSSITSVSHPFANTVLGAGASSSDDVSTDGIVNINISIGGYSVSIGVKEIEKVKTECSWSKNLKEEDYSKI